MQPLQRLLSAKRSLPLSPLERTYRRLYSSNTDDDARIERETHSEGEQHSRTSSPATVSASAEALTGSAKLFADAIEDEREEKEQERKALDALSRLDLHTNWTGDEPMEHAVLRMLVDKYKPLRTGTIRTAEEKLKSTPPKFTDVHAMAKTPLLPAVEGHRPWHTTYTAPSLDTPAIRVGSFAMPKPHQQVIPVPLDDKAKRLDRDRRKRTQTVDRVGNAKEAVLDYRLSGGSKTEMQHAQGKAPNPISLRGWTNLIEDKIEKARKAGHFNVIKGRGAPLQRRMEHSNPFIGNEEYLLNRIVQRNGASPAWVEAQAELESTLSNFRSTLASSWTRNVLANSSVPSSTLFLTPTAAHTVTEAWAATLRDVSWISRENAYHKAALADLNDKVRRYNVIAPRPVRRGLYDLKVELEKCYKDSAQDIVKGIEERRRGSHAPRPSATSLERDREVQGGAAGMSRTRDASAITSRLPQFGLWITIKKLFARVSGR